MRNKYILGMDIGGTNIRIGTHDEKGNLKAFKKVYRSSVLTGENSIESLIDFIKDYINEELDHAEIEAMAIGFPSTLSKDRKTIIQTPNIKGMDNLPIADELSKALQIKVFLERDINMLFCRDMEVYHLDEAGVNIGIYIGTGIGNAIFINGEPLVGKDGAAGELGHIPMGRGKQCGCGNQGCSECYAAGWHLVELQQQHFPDTMIDDLFTKHSKDAVIKEYIDTIARVTAIEINILNPNAIVLGGGVINMKAFPRDYLEVCIHKHARKVRQEAASS